MIDDSMQTSSKLKIYNTWRWKCYIIENQRPVYPQS